MDSTAKSSGTEKRESATILLVDDNTANLQVLRDTLDQPEHKLLIAKNGQTALAIARKALPSLILLDIMMPEMDGYEVCRQLKTGDDTRYIPVIFLTALADAENEAKGLALGAVDYLTKPLNPELVRARVRTHLELKRHRDHLEHLVAERTRELLMVQTVMIESLATLAEYRDPETGGHIKRTQNYVKALANHLKNHPRFRHELNNETISLLYQSAPLHDVGKVGVPDSILLKAGRLTDDEFEQMKKHTRYGHDALRITEKKLSKSSFLRYAREIAFSHQEKWDGSGYPSGLKGDDIPISGRLMALADVYDALISKRVYKLPLPHAEAVEIIVEGKGRHFDPDVVDAFVELEGTFRNIALTFADYDEERKILSEGYPTQPRDNRLIQDVLVVEDNEINLEIMKSQLTAAGFKVAGASNGQEALVKCQQQNYDVVLTDLEMPEMDGYSLCDAIRRMEKNTSNRTPVFAITAEAFDLNESKAKAFGFDGYLLKPLEVELLLHKLVELARDRPAGGKTATD